MTTAPVIHGHFYQPPRENPRTELVEREQGLEANLKRGQEILYEAAAKGAPLSDKAREFALALGLAPVALAPVAPEVFVNS